MRSLHVARKVLDNPKESEELRRFARMVLEDNLTPLVFDLVDYCVNNGMNPDELKYILNYHRFIDYDFNDHYDDDTDNDMSNDPIWDEVDYFNGKDD
jgi:hypothetical protein